jgi:AcrR family transcriptional regulator
MVSRDSNVRQRKRRGTTTREAIVRSALELADEIGLQALTIRAVARRANVAPMSIYTHVQSKDQLLDFMYQEVALRLYADAGHPTWQAEYVSLCHQVRQTLLQHPRWAPLLARPAPPMSVPLRERMLALMTADGFSLDEAFSAISHAGLTSIGYALVELNFRDAEGSSSLVKRFERLRKWAEQPAVDNSDRMTRAAVTKTSRFDLSALFARSIRVYVSGLEACRSRDS